MSGIGSLRALIELNVGSQLWVSSPLIYVNLHRLKLTNCILLSATTTQPALTPLFSKTTKFNDLPDELKRIFETVECVFSNDPRFLPTEVGRSTYIQGRIQISNDLKQRKVGEEATKGQDLIRSVHKVRPWID